MAKTKKRKGPARQGQIPGTDTRPPELVKLASAVVDARDALSTAHEANDEAATACIEFMAREGVKEIVLDEYSPPQRIRYEVTESRGKLKVSKMEADDGPLVEDE